MIFFDSLQGLALQVAHLMCMWYSYGAMADERGAQKGFLPDRLVYEASGALGMLTELVDVYGLILVQAKEEFVGAGEEVFGFDGATNALTMARHAFSRLELMNDPVVDSRVQTMVADKLVARQPEDATSAVDVWKQTAGAMAEAVYIVVGEQLATSGVSPLRSSGQAEAQFATAKAFKDQMWAAARSMESLPEAAQDRLTELLGTLMDVEPASPELEIPRGVAMELVMDDATLVEQWLDSLDNGVSLKVEVRQAVKEAVLAMGNVQEAVEILTGFSREEVVEYLGEGASRVLDLLNDANSWVVEKMEIQEPTMAEVGVDAELVARVETLLAHNDEVTTAMGLVLAVDTKIELAWWWLIIYRGCNDCLPGVKVRLWEEDRLQRRRGKIIETT